MKIGTLRAIECARADKRPVARVVRLSDGHEELLYESSDDNPLHAAVQTALRTDRADTIEIRKERWFIQPFNPPLRMVIVGAVHIAQPLVRMARMLGYDVTVVDPRESFANAARFPGLKVSDAWPDEALEIIKPDARTAIITLTHDPKLDDPALKLALESPAFYIGCLGSRRTHAARLGRLERKGFDAAALARIQGPVGLPLGARSPAEIAVSIMAQVTQTLRKPPP